MSEPPSGPPCVYGERYRVDRGAASKAPPPPTTTTTTPTLDSALAAVRALPLGELEAASPAVRAQLLALLEVLKLTAH